MKNNTLKYGLAGLVSGLVSAGVLCLPESLFNFLYLFIGPGILFAVAMLLMRGFRFSWWRSLLYFIITSAAYFVAVQVYLSMGDRYNDPHSLAAASAIGGLLVGFTGLLLAKQFNVLIGLGGSVLAFALAYFVPIASSGGWGPELPNIWLLFPVWQTLMGAYTGMWIPEDIS